MLQCVPYACLWHTPGGLSATTMNAKTNVSTPA